MKKEHLTGAVFAIEDHTTGYLKDLCASIDAQPLILVSMASFESGLEYLQNKELDVIFIELEGQKNRDLLISRIREISLFTPIVELITDTNDGQGLELLEQEVDDYLTIGNITADLLWRVTWGAVKHQRQMRLLSQRNHDLEQEISEWRQMGVHQYNPKVNEAVTQEIGKESWAVIAHEIRTPMNAIIGIIELVLRTKLRPEQCEQLNIVNNSARSLLEMVDNILDFSNAEIGKLHLHREQFSAQNLVDECVQILTNQAQKKALKLSWQAEADIIDVVHTDSGRLRQIILNLLDNAIKFTTKGEVTILLTQKKDEREGLMVQISVCDTGIGIPSDKLDAVFEAFTQVDISKTREYNGMGLGLSIASQLVSLLGGNIGVESILGQGSTFYFSIPLDNDKQIPADLSREIDKVGLDILLVEDDELNQQVVSGLLNNQGSRVKVAANGVEALELLDQESFDMIIMDLYMPVMDGMETTRQIRQREEHTDAHIPIVGLTAFASVRERERCMENGMDTCLNKPLDLEKLFAWMQLASNKRSYKPVLLKLDIAVLSHRFGGDSKLFEDIRDIFLDRYSKIMDNIDEALEMGDNTRAKENLHIFKGMLSHFSDNELIDITNEIDRCREIEKFVTGRYLFYRLKTRVKLLVDTLLEFDTKSIAADNNEN